MGESSAAQIEYFKHMLPTLAQPLPAATARRCAIWPNRARPRLLVLELDTSDALRMLVRECETMACKTGHDPEPRTFRAHLTLARLRPGCVLGNLLPPPPTPIVFEAITLMQSTLTQPAAAYRELARARLKRSAMQP